MSDPGTGQSLTRRDLAGRVDLAARDLDLDLVGLGLAVRYRVGLAVRDRVDPVDLADMRVQVDLAVRDRAGLVGRHLVGLADLADLADMRVRVGLVGRHRVGLADMRGRVGLAVREDLGDRDPVGRVDPVDLHRSRTHPGALTSGVAPRWAAPGMRRTASAHPTTVRRHRPHNTDSAGMVGLLPERRRLSGTDRRPLVAGTVHRLPVVGTAHGTVRRVTSL